MNIVIIPTPSDYERPDIEINTEFNIGDVVITPEGETCPIIGIKRGYTDRADVWQDRTMYEVDSKKYGTPIVWFLGWQLRRLAK